MFGGVDRRPRKAYHSSRANTQSLDVASTATRISVLAFLQLPYPCMHANHEGMNRAEEGVIANLVEEISSGAEARLEQE
jgi:hypothetical protein